MVKRTGPLLGALLLGALSVGACGVKDLDITYASAGGSGQGGKHAGGGNGNAAGGSGDGGGEGEDVPLTCKAGVKRCSSDNTNTPEVCTEDGDWVPTKPCSGSNKVCTGAGVCASFLLVNAGIDSLGARPKESKLILKRQTLSSYGRSCGKSGKCVTGGIQ